MRGVNILVREGRRDLLKDTNVDVSTSTAPISGISELTIKPEKFN